MYVALGDSYAAGVGSGPPLDDCGRSYAGYPPIVAAALGSQMDFEACLGATTTDVLTSQVQALGSDTGQVTITVGGNDAGFVPVLVSAAEPSWMSDSQPVIERALAFIRTQLPARLDRLYAEVRRRAPHATVVVTTYPRLFNGTDCELATFFSHTELAELNGAADELDDAICAAAGRAGIEVVDVREEFVGHAVCDRVEWLRGVSWPVKESFHPNAQGSAAYAAAVALRFGVESAGALVPTPDQVVLPVCPRLEAPVFRLPDLRSERSLAGAKAHGLDSEQIDSLARQAVSQDPSVDSGVAWQRLHEFDQQVRLRRAAH